MQLVKILQLIATKSGIRASSGSPNGGLESVILNLHEAFQNAGWDSHYSDSVGSNSDASIRYDLEKYNYEMYANTVRSWVEREKPDLVIAHGTNALLKYLTERGIRVLFVEHSMAISINLNSYGALFGYIAPNARTIGNLNQSKQLWRTVRLYCTERKNHRLKDNYCLANHNDNQEKGDR